MTANTEPRTATERRRGERRKRQVPIPFADRRKGARRGEEAPRSEPRAS